MEHIAELELSLDVHYNKYLGEETKRIAAEARVAQLEQVSATLLDALVWCSGCPSFGQGGTAREGWLRIAQPAISLGYKTIPQPEQSSDVEESFDNYPR
jgi:hypothetical protein